MRAKKSKTRYFYKKFAKKLVKSQHVISQNSKCFIVFNIIIKLFELWGINNFFHKITFSIFRLLTLDFVCQFRNVIFAAALLYLGSMKVTKFWPSWPNYRIIWKKLGLFWTFQVCKASARGPGALCSVLLSFISSSLQRKQTQKFVEELNFILAKKFIQKICPTFSYLQEATSEDSLKVCHLFLSID